MLPDLTQKVLLITLNVALRQQGYMSLIPRLCEIVEDVSKQESKKNPDYNRFWERKIRGLQSFQCNLMLKAVEDMHAEKLVVADIGDSAGTHMLYLRELLSDKTDLETVSVNLDQRAVDKIRKKGLKAILKRAEDVGIEDVGSNVDLFTTFEMVEHLHNPAIFFHRLAIKSSCERILVTVPYMRQSRVGLYSIRQKSNKKIFAEEEHIFELSPEDWRLLFLHSGWKVRYKKIYYQYPRRIPIITELLKRIWQQYDFEGFWGCILEKDTTYSDLYADWED